MFSKRNNISKKLLSIFIAILYSFVFNFMSIQPAAAATASSNEVVFGYVYNNVSGQQVPLNTDINFSSNGPLQGITHTAGASGITIGEDGNYNINFSVDTTNINPQGWSITVNGVVKDTFGGAGQNIVGGDELALKAGDVVTLRNTGCIPDPAVLRIGTGIDNAWIKIQKVNSSGGYVYNNVIQQIPVGSDITFNNNGPLQDITHNAGDSAITVGAAGNYNINFGINTTNVNPQDWGIAVNGTVQQEFNVAGQSIHADAVLSLNAGDVVTIRNVASAPNPATTRTIAGINSAWVQIDKLDNDNAYVFNKGTATVPQGTNINYNSNGLLQNITHTENTDGIAISNDGIYSLQFSIHTTGNNPQIWGIAVNGTVQKTYNVSGQSMDATAVLSLKSGDVVTINNVGTMPNPATLRTITGTNSAWVQIEKLDITAPPAAFGYVYQNDSTAQYIPIGSDVNFNGNGPMENMSHDLGTSGVTVAVTGNYNINFSFNSDANNPEIWGIAVNGVVQSHFSSSGQCLHAGTELSLNAGDVITLRNEGTGSNLLTLAAKTRINVNSVYMMIELVNGVGGYVYDNQATPQTIPLNSDATFNSNGPMVGVTHTPGTSGITVSEDGNYNITFAVDSNGNNPNQWGIAINGTVAQDFQNSGQTFAAGGALTLKAGDVITIRNTGCSSSAANMRPNVNSIWVQVDKVYGVGGYVYNNVAGQQIPIGSDVNYNDSSFMNGITLSGTNITISEDGVYKLNFACDTQGNNPQLWGVTVNGVVQETFGGSGQTFDSEGELALKAGDVVTLRNIGCVPNPVVLRTIPVNSAWMQIDRLGDIPAPTPAEKLAADKSALDITYGGTDSAASVTQNITLPSTLANGTTVTWTSDNTAIIGNDGTVTRPDFYAGDATVTMTASLTNGTAADTKTFTLIVTKSDKTDAEKLAEDKTALAITYGGTDSAVSVTQNITLPLTLTNGTAVTWTSSNTPVLGNGGRVTRPEFGAGDAAVTMTAQLTNGTATGTKTFTMIVSKKLAAAAPAAPSVTAEDAANTVTGMAAGMEYSLDGAAYVPFDAAAFNAINFSGNHTVNVRVAANASTGAPASAITALKFTSTPTASVVNVTPTVSADSTSAAVNVTINESQIKMDGTNIITVPNSASSVSTSIGITSIKNGVGTEEVHATVGENALTLTIPFDAVNLSSINDSTAKFVLSQRVSSDAEAAGMLANAPAGDKTIGKVFSFNLDVAGKPVHNFADGKTATIAIKLTADDIKGLDTSKLSAFYYDETSDKWIQVGGSYNPKTMIFTFSTTHFTSFTIMQKSTSTVSSTLPKTGSPVDFFTLILIGVSFLGAGLFITVKKWRRNI